jgi:hypothetical protein
MMKNSRKPHLAVRTFRAVKRSDMTVKIIISEYIYIFLYPVFIAAFYLVSAANGMQPAETESSILRRTWVYTAFFLAINSALIFFAVKDIMDNFRHGKMKILESILDYKSLGDYVMVAAAVILEILMIQFMLCGDFQSARFIYVSALIFCCFLAPVIFFLFKLR